MIAEAKDSQEEFIDYCLVLQVHPDADAGMIEAAYWYLARRYNEQAESDPLAKAQLDMLNEAYSVLGTPPKREAYFEVRNAVLGAGVLPSAPEPKREPPPLTVMGKQRPGVRQSSLPQTRSWFDLRFKRFVEPSWQNALLVLVLLGLAMSMLGVSASLAIVLPLLTLAIVIGVVPFVRAAFKSLSVDRNDPPAQTEPVLRPRR
jgi:hypothetical protein